LSSFSDNLFSIVNLFFDRKAKKKSVVIIPRFNYTNSIFYNKDQIYDL